MSAEPDPQAAQRRARLLRMMLRDRGLSAASGVIAVPREGLLPSSFAQERMWFWDRVTAPRSFLHNVPLTVRLRGPLDVDVLGRALNAVIARHESLRTSFSLHGPQLVQRVHDRLKVGIEIHDVRSAGGEAEQQAQQVAYLAARRPFDLTRLPLLRAAVIRIADDDHILVFDVHHMVWDGWSTGLLVHEWAAHYAALRSGRRPEVAALPVQYQDWVAWQRRYLCGDTLRRHVDYWKKELAGVPLVRVPPVVTDTSGLTSDVGSAVTFAVPPDITEALGQLARDEDATLYMVLLAAFTAVLHRTTGEPDLAIGGLIANRTRAGIESLIGFFVNTIPFRTRVGPASTFRTHLRSVRATTVLGYEHQALPLGRILRALADSRPELLDRPVYSVDFQLQTAPRPATDFGGVGLEVVDRTTRTADFDLGMILWQRRPDLAKDDGLQGWCEFRTDVVDEAAARRLVERYLAVLEAVARQPSIRLVDLPVFTDWDQAGGVVLPRVDEAPAEPVAEAVATWARRSPGRPAILTQGGVVSYQELASQIDGAASALMRAGLGCERLVAVVGGATVGTVAGVCAALACGGGFAVLEPDRLDVLDSVSLELSDAIAVLLDEGVDLPAPPGVEVVRLPEHPAGNLAPGARPPPVSGALAQVALVARHLGGTDRVLVENAALAHRVQGVRLHLGIGAGDVVACPGLTPDGYAVAWVLAALTAGASLRFVDHAALEDAGKAAELVDRDAVSVLLLPRSALPSFLAAARAGNHRFSALRTVVVAGAPPPPELVRSWCGAYPEARLLTRIGGPECGDVATPEPSGEVLGEDSGLGVSATVGSSALHVVDLLPRTAARGVRGELTVGGPGLARGFAGDAARTAEVFGPDPFSPVPGARMYRSGERAWWELDRRVEVRVSAVSPRIDGRVVDLERIEATLRADPLVKDVVTVVQPDDDLGARVIAYVVPAPEADAARSLAWSCEGCQGGASREDAAGGGTLVVGCGTDTGRLPAGLWKQAVVSGLGHLPDGDALTRVIREVVNRIVPEGRMVLRGVRSLPLLHAFHAEVELLRAQPGTLGAQLRARVGAAVRTDPELAVDPRWFLRAGTVRRVASVDLLPRAGPDLVDGHRFDVILHLDRPAPRVVPEQVVDWTQVGNLEALERLIGRRRPRGLAVRGVPDARCVAALAVQRALDEPLPGATVDGLRRATAPATGGVLPSELVACGARQGYRMGASVDLEAPGHLVALFVPNDDLGEVPRAPHIPSEATPGGWLATAPDPRRRGALAGRLRRRLSGILSPFLVPTIFVELEALPRANDGQVDVALLPALTSPSARSAGPAKAPRDRVERRLVHIWGDVLDMVGIGAADRLCEDLQVPRLLLPALSARLEEEFGVRVSGAQLLEASRITALAEIVRARGRLGGSNA